jgi:hypothetical protein
MNLQPSFAPLTLLFVLLFAQAKAQHGDYAYQRELEGITEEWHEVPLPDLLFGKLRTDLADLRIIGVQPGGDTLEAPYLLRRQEREWVQKEVRVTLLNQSSSKGVHYYTFQLPDSRVANQLQLQFSRDNFDWLATLEGSHNQRQWYLLAENQRILSLKNEQTSYRFTSLRFPKTNYPYLRLSIRSAESPLLLAATLTEQDTLPGKYRELAPSHFEIVQHKKEKQTELLLSLPQAVPVSAIRLQLADAMDYYRPLRIQYLADSVQTPRGWHHQYRTLTTATLSSLEESFFHFPTTIAKSFRIIIDNFDNAPLAIGQATLSSPEWVLAARFSQPARYYLLYGNASARPPVYDLSWFKDKIPPSLTALQPGEEQRLQTGKALAEPLFKNKFWLWGAMGVIMLLLGGFTLQMLKKG